MSAGERFTQRHLDGTIRRRSRRHLTEAEEAIYWLAQELDAATHVAARYREAEMITRAILTRQRLREACQAFLAEPVIDGPASSR